MNKPVYLVLSILDLSKTVYLFIYLFIYLIIFIQVQSISYKNCSSYKVLFKSKK